MSEQSEQIGELAAALSKAQGKITGALKDSANPFFKSKYADLASVWDACRVALSENQLAVIQQTESDDSGVFVITTLAHSSGQWMRSRLRLTPKDGSPQSMGSAITYGRRYALAAAVGVAQVDDDGNAASGKVPSTVATVDPRGPLGGTSDTDSVAKWVSRIADAMASDDQAGAIYAIHHELSPDEVLYIDVADAAAKQDVCSKGKWKELVRAGNPNQRRGKAA